MGKTSLSIIIPALNEAEALPLLLNDLAVQQDIDFETIVVDGGSLDETVSVANHWFETGKLNGRCISSEKGRGRQLNAGVALAASEWFLFLHADSRILGSLQIKEALDYLQFEVDRNQSDRIAGRFSLSFDSQELGATPIAFHYYETKAKLGRPGSIHGDQGMFLKSSFFNEVGPFREDLPVMEDTSLAELIRHTGCWLLLPGTIVTSTRRFLTEGMRERQTLNALMMNFLAIGWLDFFSNAHEIYRQQSKTGRLETKPFFRLISDLLYAMPVRERFRIWLATGEFVRSQAWQIGLYLDCRKDYKEGARNFSPGHWLSWFDKWFDPLTNNTVGRTITAALVRIWFAFQ